MIELHYILVQTRRGWTVIVRSGCWIMRELCFILNKLNVFQVCDIEIVKKSQQASHRRTVST